MWQIPDLIMTACTSTMGEPITLLSGVTTYTLNGIYEEATDVDETEGLADIENYSAMVDFRMNDLVVIPKQRDIVTVLRTGKAYRILYVVSDGWARHRCYLRDV